MSHQRLTSSYLPPTFLPLHLIPTSSHTSTFLPIYQHALITRALRRESDRSVGKPPWLCLLARGNTPSPPTTPTMLANVPTAASPTPFSTSPQTVPPQPSLYCLLGSPPKILSRWVNCSSTETTLFLLFLRVRVEKKKPKISVSRFSQLSTLFSFQQFIRTSSGERFNSLPSAISHTVNSTRKS